MLNKICTCCNKTFYAIKVEDFSKNFHKAKVGKYGFTAKCKICRFETEIVPNREKRAEYDRQRYSFKSITKTCIVCNNEFLAQREDINCCSKECTKFKKKVYYKMNKDKYYSKTKEKRQKDIIKNKDNFRKRYTFVELEYIKKNIYNPKLIARKLGRTLNAISKKVGVMKNEI